MSSSTDRERIKKFCDSKLYLASNQEVFILLGGQPEFSKLARNVAEIDISYDSFNEHTTIDLEQYSMLLVYDSPIEDIAQHLKKIKENDDRFYKKVSKSIESQSKVQHVVVHNSTVEESHKYRIYKYICSEGKHSTVEIANQLGMDKEYVLGLLIELMKVDELIDYFPRQDDNDDNVEWYKK